MKNTNNKDKKKFKNPLSHIPLKDLLITLFVLLSCALVFFGLGYSCRKYVVSANALEVSSLDFIIDEQNTTNDVLFVGNDENLGFSGSLSSNFPFSVRGYLNNGVFVSNALNVSIKITSAAGDTTFGLGELIAQYSNPNYPIRTLYIPSISAISGQFPLPFISAPNSVVNATYDADKLDDSARFNSFIFSYVFVNLTGGSVVPQMYPVCFADTLSSLPSQMINYLNAGNSIGVINTAFIGKTYDIVQLRRFANNYEYSKFSFLDFAIVPVSDTSNVDIYFHIYAETYSNDIIEFWHKYDTISTYFPVSSSTLSLADPLVYSFSNISSSDLETSYNQGFEQGYESGKSDGYNQGFTDGTSQKLNDITPWQHIVNAVNNFMKINLIGDISIGILLQLCIGFVLFGAIIKLFLGG